MSAAVERERARFAGVPPYADLAAHALDHVQAAFVEASERFGDHGSDFTEKEKSLMRSVADMIARQLLIRYGREAALKQARGGR